jgi:hypothetical protein
MVRNALLISSPPSIFISPINLVRYNDSESWVQLKDDPIRKSHVDVELERVENYLADVVGSRTQELEVGIFDSNVKMSDSFGTLSFCTLLKHIFNFRLSCRRLTG